MAKQIFVNLPVKDLNKSVEFFTKLGYTFNPQFTDENATCMIVGENIFVMLLLEKFFNSFTNKPTSDAFRSAEVIISLSAENKAEVDSLIEKAVAAGGRKTKLSDDGWMYQGGFEDLDGHLWEIAYMDLSQFPQQ